MGRVFESSEGQDDARAKEPYELQNSESMMYQRPQRKKIIIIRRTMAQQEATVAMAQAVAGAEAAIAEAEEAFRKADEAEEEAREAEEAAWKARYWK
ncbi:unnamed protein product [Prunus brigantina]